MRRFLLASPVLALAGCSLPFGGPDCRDETRSLSTRAALASVVAGAAPGDTGTASISMSESRNARTKRTSSRGVMWFAGSGVPRATVTAVHVHETGSDRLLFDVPLDSTHGPPYVITQVFEQKPYAGPVPWNETYQLLGESRAYVDVHTTTRPQGQLRGTLQPQSPGWQNFVHAYCS